MTVTTIFGERYEDKCEVTRLTRVVELLTPRDFLKLIKMSPEEQGDFQKQCEEILDKLVKHLGKNQGLDPGVPNQELELSMGFLRLVGAFNAPILNRAPFEQIKPKFEKYLSVILATLAEEKSKSKYRDFCSA